MTTIINWIKSYEFTTLLALYTYWTPLVICLAVYACRFVRAYREDVKKSAETYYSPILTVGAILGHLFLAVTPAVNLFALVFDCAGSVFRWFGRVLDIPLVRKRS